MEIKQK